MAWVEKHGRTWRVRYWREDGPAGSVPGFQSEPEAREHAATLQDHRTPQPTAPAVRADAPLTPAFIAPAEEEPAGVGFADWLETWWDTIDVGDNTLASYRSLTKNHLLPRWGSIPLTGITPSQVQVWVKELHTTHRPSTVSAIRKLLALILADAVEEGLLTTNPVRKRNRGRTRSHDPAQEKIWADEHEVRAIASRVLQLASPNQALLVITAAYTGMRWGELAGLRRENCHLSGGQPRLVIHPQSGALHEINGHLTYGPPKTPASARTITLPAFLAELLANELNRHRHAHVFTSIDGKHLRRSCFGRRTWAPAVNGTNLSDGTVWKPLKPGLTFHGLRHSHKTWMIEDGLPDVVQARRLGHRMGRDIDDIYSHVASALNDKLLSALTARWNRSVSATAA
ncbi:tyrosine-type recombinase/integrase [Streptacidiphilus neutrinimicus]|uniref:tyrosine-type recombinase/integrase n=1 Tax=Streptacidiphilus neutrinimicus TaxID=105420 RepID=UPI0005A8F5C8|nr:site-specific integrase [Streptacidiphilus neutrinimicus]